MLDITRPINSDPNCNFCRLLSVCIFGMACSTSPPFIHRASPLSHLEEREDGKKKANKIFK